MEVRKIGDTIVRRSHGDPIISDTYRVEVEEQPDITDIPKEAMNWVFDGLSIGCPKCKQNTQAWLRGGTYTCATCGYRDTLSGKFEDSTGLLYQATTLNPERFGTWDEVIHKVPDL